MDVLDDAGRERVGAFADQPVVGTVEQGESEIGIAEQPLEIGGRRLHFAGATPCANFVAK